MHIPDKHLRVPDNFTFCVEDDDELGRCVRIYNGKELFWTFTHFTGNKATIVKKAKKKLILALTASLLHKHKLLDDDYTPS